MSVTLKTQHLIIRPCEDAEIEKLIESTKEKDLAFSYQCMLDAAKNDPQHRVWFVPWIATVKKTGAIAGVYGFLGPAENNAVEVGFSMEPGYAGSGLDSEGLEVLTNWALRQSNVFYVETEVAGRDKKTRSVLDLLGYEQYGRGDEGPRYVINRRERFLLPVGAVVGVALGTAFGFAFDVFRVALTVGTFAGLIVGLLMDYRYRQRVKRIAQDRELRLGAPVIEELEAGDDEAADGGDGEVVAELEGELTAGELTAGDGEVVAELEAGVVDATEAEAGVEAEGEKPARAGRWL